MANELEVVAFHYQTHLPIDFVSTESVGEAVKVAEEMSKREPRNSVLIRPKSVERVPLYITQAML